MLIITARERERLSATNNVNIIKRMSKIGRKEVNMAKNNYPQAGLDEIEPAAVQQIVSSLKELHDKGRPKTDEEVEERINEYFSFCERSSIRPGIESLCLSLHISRTTLFKWNRGIDCSLYRQELTQSAKAFISAFIEQAMLGGKISPPSGIFLAKNWLGYKDTISIEESIPEQTTERALTAAELPKLGDLKKLD